MEIIKDILEVVKNKSGKIKQTHILYKSNLSHQMMDLYLKELIEKKFIIPSENKNTRVYSITEKGITYLNKYKLISEFTQSFGLDVSEDL
ncbi:hypothetical protein HYW75_01120 [Candidatus Pacearchaeota archaeon]|nr:hypothetical protein [Candidatus Pacearchaeota archaeon]